MKNTKLKTRVEDTENILEVSQLSVIYQRRSKKFLAVDDLSFNIKKGEIFGLVGESGCGKTTTARSTIGLVPYTSGSIKINNHVVNKTTFTKKIKKEFMVKNMQMIFQDPFSSLNPTKRVIDNVIEGFNNFNPFKKEAKKQSKIIKLKKKLFKKANTVFQEKINQFENCIKEIIQITEQINHIKKELITKIKLEQINEKAVYQNKVKSIKKKKNVIAAKYEQWLKNEKIRFNNEVKNAFKSGEYNEKSKIKTYKNKLDFIDKEAYNKMLLLFKTKREELKKHCISLKQKWKNNYVNNKPLIKENFRNKKLELINEKNMLLKRIKKLKEQKNTTINKINDLTDAKNIKTVNKEEIKSLKIQFLVELKKIQSSLLSNIKENKSLNELNAQKEKLTEKYISQLKNIDYYSAVKEETKLFWATNYSKNAIKQKTIKLAYETLKNVGLLPEHGNRFASELSGGQRQRVGIARAIIMNPSLLIADEPISALDVSIQAQVINILKDLRSTQNLSILLIAHDLRMVNYLCDRIAVINEGRIVEIGKSDNIYHSPIHPYTKSLMSAIPSIDNVGKNIIPLEYIPLRYEFDAIDLPQLWKIDDEDHFVYGTNQQIQAWKKINKERKK